MGEKKGAYQPSPSMGRCVPTSWFRGEVRDNLEGPTPPSFFMSCCFSVPIVQIQVWPSFVVLKICFDVIGHSREFLTDSKEVLKFLKKS